jgi:hypothetical protein
LLKGEVSLQNSNPLNTNEKKIKTTTSLCEGENFGGGAI